MNVSQKEIQDHLESGVWKQLQQLAERMVADAEERAGAKMQPILGGGTRLMFDLQHRISDDIDLFIRDPQWIGYLSPRLNDRFDDLVAKYDEGSSSLKLHLHGGEIDFIVAPSLLGLPPERSTLTPFAIEPVSEVLAKKLFYRGWAMTPRDLFDWWFVSMHAPGLVAEQKIADLLSSKFDEIQTALAAISGSGAAATKWEQIKANNKLPIELAAQWAMSEIGKYRQLANASDPGSNAHT